MNRALAVPIVILITLALSGGLLTGYNIAADQCNQKISPHAFGLGYQAGYEIAKNNNDAMKATEHVDTMTQQPAIQTTFNETKLKVRYITVFEWRAVNGTDNWVANYPEENKTITIYTETPMFSIQLTSEPFCGKIKLPIYIRAEMPAVAELQPNPNPLWKENKLIPEEEFFKLGNRIMFFRMDGFSCMGEAAFTSFLPNNETTLNFRIYDDNGNDLNTNLKLIKVKP